MDTNNLKIDDESTAFDDKIYLQLAIAVADENVRNGNGGPFGAVIVGPEGEIYSKGNSVTTTIDPTAHAEVNAIRFACEQIGSFDLSGYTLYSSCEPCPMCLGASLWSRVDRVVFAADRYDAANAGFDDAAFYEKLERGGVAQHIEVEEHNHPFELWAEKATRTDY